MSINEAGGPPPAEIYSDFLIIGSGLAGLYAALYAAGRVFLFEADLNCQCAIFIEA